MLRPFLMSLLLAQFLGLDCGERRKKPSQNDKVDGGYVFREECILPTDNCYVACQKREASDTCLSCCTDQAFLCDTKQPHSFANCDDAP